MNQEIVPSVTIAIACHNAADTIERSIEAALNQIYPNFYILIVDDASEDNSVEVINALIKDQPRIRLIQHTENGGSGKTRNTILNNTKTEFLAFQDDDDESHPDRLIKQYRTIQAYQKKHKTELIFCYCNRLIVNRDNVVIQASGIGSKEPAPFGEMVANNLLWGYQQGNYAWGLAGTGTLFVSTNLLKSLGGFDISFRRFEDWDLAIKAALKGTHFISANDDLLIQHKTTSLDKTNTALLEYKLRLIEKYKSYLKKKNIYISSKILAHAMMQERIGRKKVNFIFRVIACLLSPRTYFPIMINTYFLKNSANKATR